MTRNNSGSASNQAACLEKHTSQGAVADLEQPTPLYRIPDIFEDLAHRLTPVEQKLCVSVSIASPLRALDQDESLRLVLLNLKYLFLSKWKKCACPRAALYSGTEGVISQFITSDATCSLSVFSRFVKHLFMNPEVGPAPRFLPSFDASQNHSTASNNFEILFSSFVPIMQLL